jgi:hypothetical protein
MSVTSTTITMADQLRAVADLIDAHPDLPTPTVFAYRDGAVDVAWQLMNDEATKDDQRTAAQRILREIGGKWTKSAWDERFDFEQKRDNGLTLQILTHREQVCTRRVVGTETVTIPAVEAKPERTEEREVVEWDCDPVLTEAVSA